MGGILTPIMARETVPAASSAHADRSGRGLVVSGAIITAISLAITTVVAIYFVAGLVSSPQAMSIIFPFLLLSWLALAMPTWIAGIVLLGSGRQMQRGRVRGQAVTWIFAAGSLPVIAVLLVAAITSSITGTDVTFILLVVSIPLMIVVSIAAGAWLVWGRRQDGGLAAHAG